MTHHLHALARRLLRCIDASAHGVQTIHHPHTTLARLFNQPCHRLIYQCTPCRIFLDLGNKAVARISSAMGHLYGRPFLPTFRLCCLFNFALLRPCLSREVSECRTAGSWQLAFGILALGTWHLAESTLGTWLVPQQHCNATRVTTSHACKSILL